MKQTSLKPLFVDQLKNFGHLVTVEQQTKAEFLKTIEKAYSLENPKTNHFYMAVNRSTFETIRKAHSGGSFLFNQ